jgi:hypothetical protein
VLWAAHTSSIGKNCAAAAATVWVEPDSPRNEVSAYTVSKVYVTLMQHRMLTQDRLLLVCAELVNSSVWGCRRLVLRRMVPVDETRLATCMHEVRTSGLITTSCVNL